MFLAARVKRFYRDNGLLPLMKHAAVKLSHKVIVRPDVIYFADLPGLELPKCDLAGQYQIVERGAANALIPRELEQLGTHIEHKTLEYQIANRFKLGASLWLLKQDTTCLAMIWTVVGTSVEPFYYFIGAKDVHFFNNEVFKPHRGKGLNPQLIEHVLFQMRERGLVRAYIETSQSNVAEQRSLSKTSFGVVGTAAKLCIGRTRCTIWRLRSSHKSRQFETRATPTG